MPRGIAVRLLLLSLVVAPLACADIGGEGIVSAAVFLSPLALGIAAFWPASRAHWAAVLLATPALLLGLALVAALFNNARGPGILGALLYAPTLLAVGGGAIVRWYRRWRWL